MTLEKFYAEPHRRFNPLTGEWVPSLRWVSDGGRSRIDFGGTDHQAAEIRSE
jgi:hypothetical protein